MFPFFFNRIKKPFIGLFIAGILCSRITIAQISFFYNETPIHPSSETLAFYIDSSNDHSWERYTSIKKDMRPFLQNDFSLSYKNQMIWLRLSFNAFANDPLAYLMIRNPHINYMGAWLLKNDSLVKSFPPTGDRRPFATRPINHPDFLFPVPEDSLDTHSYIILIDKRNEIINIPIHLLTGPGFLKYDRSKNLITGLFVGLSLFLFFFNLFLYFNMRDRVYIYYGIYIFLAIFYIISDFGFAFMYLFPDHPLFADFARPLSISFATPVYILFCLEILNAKKNLPSYYRWMMRALLAYTLIFVVSMFFFSNKGSVRIVLSSSVSVIPAILMVGNFIIAIVSYRKKIPYSIYIILSSLMLMITVYFFSEYLTGKLPDTIINRNLMKIAISTELIFLGLVLSHRFKKYKVESEKLLLQVSEQQEHIFRSVADYQEKELQRLSSMLHDSIGARLSALRFNLESGNEILNGRINKAITEVNDLANEVRQFSHNLSPTLLQQKGLAAALHQFISFINDSGKLQIQFEMIGSLERSSFQYELLINNIIQELIQNILKHAVASEAIIQVILEDNLVSLFVEDNGTGFDSNAVKEGLGFSQIKQLITFVNGTFRVDSSKNNGTRISIEFTAIPNERKHPHTDSR